MSSADPERRLGLDEPILLPKQPWAGGLAPGEPEHPSTPAAVPRPPRDLVDRAVLVQRLGQADQPAMVLQAPAGYGKTTLLRQWSDSDERPFAWLSLDSSDDDPLVLLAYLLAALEAPEQERKQLLSGPLADPAFLHAVTIPRLIECWASRTRPLVLVIDDVHVLHHGTCWSVLAALVAAMPSESHLVLAGRRKPPLPLARWLAHQQLLWLGESELAMTRDEAAAVLAHHGVHLDPLGERRLLERVQGWPAALTFAGHHLLDARDPAGRGDPFASGTSPFAEYLRQEVLAGLSPQLTEFLYRTSVLSVLAADSCDAVLGEHGSGTYLQDLLDGGLIQPWMGGRGFHAHPLLRALLNEELRLQEPENEPILHRRAAEWLQKAGRVGEAIEHARLAGDRALAAALLWQTVPDQLSNGRRPVLEAGLRRFSERELLGRPHLALAMAWCAMESGRQVEPWAAAADRALHAGASDDAGATLTAPLYLLKANLGEDGLPGMAAAAEAAYTQAPADDPWRALACYLAGTALHLQGDAAAAAKRLLEGEQLSRLLSAPTVQALCLARRSLLAFDDGDWDTMQPLAAHALDLVARNELTDLATMATVFGTAALSQAHDQRRDDAERTSRHAMRLLSYIAPRIPWLGLEVRTLLAWTHLLLGDAPAARVVLAEAQAMLSSTIEAPVLRRRLENAWSLVTAAPLSTRVGPSSLTTAELRVLQLLPTHLSFQEIGQALFLSRNTVKTQAISAYRKLGVGSRSEAVECARSLGLLAKGPRAVP